MGQSGQTNRFNPNLTCDPPEPSERKNGIIKAGHCCSPAGPWCARRWNELNGAARPHLRFPGEKGCRLALKPLVQASSLLRPHSQPMPSLTDGEVVQNFQSRALKLSRDLDSVRREIAERQRELSASEKVSRCYHGRVVVLLALTCYTRCSRRRTRFTAGCRRRLTPSSARLKKPAMH